MYIFLGTFIGLESIPFTETYIKRTVSVILSDPPSKDENIRFTTVPLKPQSDKKYGVFPMIIKKCASQFRREPANENKPLKLTLQQNQAGIL